MQLLKEIQAHQNDKEQLKQEIIDLQKFMQREIERINYLNEKENESLHSTIHKMGQDIEANIQEINAKKETISQLQQTISEMQLKIEELENDLTENIQV